MVVQEWFIVYIVYYGDARDMRDYFGKFKFTFVKRKYLDICNLYIFILCSVCVKLPRTYHSFNSGLHRIKFIAIRKIKEGADYYLEEYKAMGDSVSLVNS